MGMRLLETMLLPFARRTAWARGRLTYRVLVTLAATGRAETARRAGSR